MAGLREKISLSGEAKRRLTFYGFGSFTGLMSILPLAQSTLFYFVAGAGLLGGAAGLVGLLLPLPGHRPTLVFVSTGGTCRDPMAKAIMDDLLSQRPIAVRVLAAALITSTAREASKAARLVVKEEMGSDLLKNHVPSVLEDALVSEADLILTMEEAHVQHIAKNFPNARNKVHTLPDFVELTGEIEDPWRGYGQIDAETIARYRMCFRKLRDVLNANVDRIYDAVVA